MGKFPDLVVNGIERESVRKLLALRKKEEKENAKRKVSYHELKVNDGLAECLMALDEEVPSDESTNSEKIELEDPSKVKTKSGIHLFSWNDVSKNLWKRVGLA